MATKDLYAGKYFYEVMVGADDHHTIVGPLDNIRYLESDTEDNHEPPELDYGYAQIINDKIVKVFKSNKILVLNYDIKKGE